MSYDQPLWLADAIASDRFEARWKDSSMPEGLKPVVAKIDAIAFSLDGLDSILEADEYLTETNNQGMFDYLGLSSATRAQLLRARRELAANLRLRIDSLLKVAMQPEGELS